MDTSWFKTLPTNKNRSVKNINQHGERPKLLSKLQIIYVDIYLHLLIWTLKNKMLSFW